MSKSILYVHCKYLLIWSPTQLKKDFSFYDFPVIYYDFFKIALRSNLTGF
jgi:hypothetical protein